MMARAAENPIDKAAGDWAVAIDRGLSPHEQETLTAWLSADPRHRGALVRAQAVWFSAIGRGAPRTAAPMVHELSAGRRVRPGKLLPRRRLLIGGAIAAGVGGLGLTALLYEERYETDRGEVRRVALADGSGLVMNTDARLAVRLTADRRRVRLDSGEAWFDVAKDRARPFVVTFGAARVTAVGTAFSIRRAGPDGDEVLVTEGVVEIGGGGDAALRVAQGHRAVIPAGGRPRVTPVPPRDLQRHLAWREGMIMLDGERLADAAAQFNRYGARPITVAPALADRRVVGVFQARDAEGFARATGAMLSAPVSVGRDAIRIGPQDGVTENSR